MRLKLLCVALQALAALAATPEEIYRSRIRPTLDNQCVGCHSGPVKMSNLDLSSRDSMLQGGKRGAGMVPGKGAESLLYKAVAGSDNLLMPPGKKLPDEIAEAFKVWIDGGAPVVSEKATGPNWSAYKDEDLWAFRPLRQKFAQNSIDAFLNERLREKALAAAPRADKLQLIRRATFDLTGLPPTPEEVAAFLKDTSQLAWTNLVDRLLASPRYGERWARHWLDVARYADTGGYSNDFERPNAWRYRDYVIRSFNNDKPYDRFIQEQIAGDELFPDDPEALIAVGFLRSGPWEYTNMSAAVESRQTFLDDVTHGTASTFLGLTLGCARCHDHKFDPLPTRDYYRMQAVFATTAFARRKVDFLPAERREVAGEGKRQMDAILAQLQGKIAGFDKGAKSPEAQEQLKLYKKHLSLYEISASRFEPLAFSVSSGLLPDANDVGPQGEKNYLKKEDYETAKTHILTGGSLASAADEVTPGVLSAVEKYSGYPAPEIPGGITGRRAALAKWIAGARNPLTARVMVNRIWQYHFGSAIAGNSSNFGKMGKKPSHPELLDWLATRFVESGWSIKALHRSIMLSDAYQRSSTHPQPKLQTEKDPDGGLLASFPARRLEAEVLRDSMLSVSGELSLIAGGPGTYPQINQDAAEQPIHAMGSLMPAYYPSPRREDRNRRSIYSVQRRSLVDPLIEVFNAPSMDLSCERRDSTIVPTQAFSLFNSQFSYDRALALALRVQREAPATASQVDRAFLLVLNRTPSAEERDAAIKHIGEMDQFHRKNPPPARTARKPLVRSITSELTGAVFRFEEQPPPSVEEQNVDPAQTTAETRALADFALVLLNSNEFAFLL